METDVKVVMVSILIFCAVLAGIWFIQEQIWTGKFLLLIFFVFLCHMIFTVIRLKPIRLLIRRKMR